MKATFYAVFNARGFVRSVKGLRGHQPALQGGERAIRVQVSIPDAAFKPEGIPTASVEVPEEAVIHPTPEPVVTVLPPEETHGSG